MGVILFEKLGLKGGKKTKTGYSTAADILEKLAPEYPIVKDILEYRQLTKLKSTYADGLANVIAEDGRIILPLIRQSRLQEESAVRSQTCRIFR